MAFNGAGVFTRLFSWAADKAGGIKIRADKMDQEMDGFAAGLSNCITRDGQSTVAADIPFNGKKITGLGTPTAGNDAATKSYVDGAAFGGNRNKIINGNFAVNQRAVSGTVTLAAGAYGHDRWKAGASGCTYTFITAGIDTTITIVSGSLVQVVEGNNVEAGNYTLSWFGTATARAAAGGGTPSGAYASGPLLVGAVSAGFNVTVEFTLGTLTTVQLERGGSNTSFERRHYGLELSLCQRYYQKSYNYSAAPGIATSIGAVRGGNNAGGTLVLGVQLPVVMRAAPTIRLWDENGNGPGIVISYSAGGVPISRAVTANNVADRSFTIGFTTTDVTFVAQYDASAEL